MPFQSDEEIHKILDPHIPEVSRLYLAEYIGRLNEIEKIALPDLIIESLRKLPINKRIRFDKHHFALNSVGWLLDEVLNTDSRKAEMLILYQQSRARLELAQRSHRNRRAKKIS